MRSRHGTNAERLRWSRPRDRERAGCSVRSGAQQLVRASKQGDGPWLTVGKVEAGAASLRVGAARTQRRRPDPGWAGEVSPRHGWDEGLKLVGQLRPSWDGGSRQPTYESHQATPRVNHSFVGSPS